ncbi:MAG: nucleotidyltransferase domain-containing protein [Planctomycetes bacterium]|nr:nucleotidyltransferase domain-containing protein [Planctomycetota bacterium]
MDRHVSEHREALAELCRRHYVRRLELFGSAARGTFDVETSDLDFLVEFEDLAPALYAEHYFDLLHAFEDLFARPIDLLPARSIRNPYLAEEIARDRTLLYAA